MNALPELLVPVGSPDKLATALRYGADAVYLGGQALSLRAKTDGFSFPQLREAVNLAHASGADQRYVDSFHSRPRGPMAQ